MVSTPLSTKEGTLTARNRKAKRPSLRENEESDSEEDMQMVCCL